MMVNARIIDCTFHSWNLGTDLGEQNNTCLATPTLSRESNRLHFSPGWSFPENIVISVICAGQQNSECAKGAERASCRETVAKRVLLESPFLLCLLRFALKTPGYLKGAERKRTLQTARRLLRSFGAPPKMEELSIMLFGCVRGRCKAAGDPTHDLAASGRRAKRGISTRLPSYKPQITNAFRTAVWKQSYTNPLWSYYLVQVWPF